MAADAHAFGVRAAAVLLVIAMAAGSGVAQDGPAQAEAPPAKADVVRDLQRAVRTNDRAWVAARIRYPLRYHGRTVAVIRNREDFLRGSGSFISDRLRSAILVQDPERVFENWQGMMVGDGTHNMWLRESGEGNALRYEIVTINDSR
jgi:hypothetical protein